MSYIILTSYNHSLIIFLYLYYSYNLIIYIIIHTYYIFYNYFPLNTLPFQLLHSIIYVFQSASAASFLLIFPLVTASLLLYTRNLTKLTLLWVPKFYILYTLINRCILSSNNRISPNIQYNSFEIFTNLQTPYWQISHVSIPRPDYLY